MGLVFVLCLHSRPGLFFKEGSWRVFCWALCGVVYVCKEYHSQPVQMLPEVTLSFCEIPISINSDLCN